jgi:hypothetical protein
MGDRAYSWFAIPLRILADPARALQVQHIFHLDQVEMAACMLRSPTPEAESGVDCMASRLVDGVPCLVIEKTEALHGGALHEAGLASCQIPFLQRNGAGQAFAPTAMAFAGHEGVIIRTDPGGHPIAAIRMAEGEAVASPHELADLEAYMRLRQLILTAT